MTLATTPAFISTVDENYTVVLPNSIPIGSKVAVFLIPSEKETEAQQLRRTRFAKVMAAIRNAIADGFTAPDMSDQELNARIQRARCAAKITVSHA